MPITPPVEGSSNLPNDTGNRRFLGLWNTLSGFLASRGSSEGHAITQSEKGIRVHLTSAPTQVATLILAANLLRRSAQFINWGAATVFVGKDATVSVVNGTPIPQYGAWPDMDGTEAWWGITTAGLTCDVRGWETSGPYS